MRRWASRSWGVYSIAVAATAIALVTRLLIESLVDGHHPFSTLFFAVFFSAWIGGFGPALVTLLLGLLTTLYFFIPANGTLSMAYSAHEVGVLLYVLLGLATAVLGESQIRAQRRAESKAEQAQRQQAALEKEIAERRRAEQLLLESEARFRTVANAAPVAIWMIDAQGMCTFMNKPWLVMTAHTQEQVLGQGWLEDLHPLDRQPTRDALMAAVRSRRAYEIEFRLRRPNGSYRWMLGSGIPLLRPDGEFAGYIGSAIDFTGRKEAEQALLEADRHKNEFLAMLAHELRNPLAPLRNALDLLRLRPDSETVDWAYDLMERQMSQMVRLVDDLLDVSRITRGKISLQFDMVELSQVIALAVETARPVICAQGHRFDVLQPERPIYLQADPTRLSQALSNLLNNAAKYTLPGGEIALVVEQAADTVTLRVRDSGLGIAPEELRHIFDLFAQSNRSLDRCQGGLGIGLTLVRYLVDLHGGSITAHSAGLGQGSEFVIRLPTLRHAEMLATTAPASAQIVNLNGDPHAPALPGTSARASTEPRPFVGRRLLVVDDKPDLAATVGKLLDLQGHDVRIATDGAAALELARDFHPEMVLVDLGMPGMSGYEVARRFRMDETIAGALLVALTGWGQEEDRRRSHDAGFDFHLVKPATAAALEEAVLHIDDEARTVPVP